jgi:2-keto-4-pentenoate hydratase
MTNDSLIARPDRPAAAQIMFDLSNGHLVDGPAPAALRSYDDASMDDGLALQVSVLELWQQAGEALGGWKIGWTSRSARDRGGVGFRPFGYVLTSRMLNSGAQLKRADVPNAVIEPEICVTIGHRLAGPDVSPAEAKAAVTAVAPAFEVISHRLPDGVAIPVRIGNGLNNWGLVIGEDHSPDVDLADLYVELRRDGELVSSSGTGPDVVDDAYLSLSRVAGELAKFGLALEPGQRVITGSIVPGLKVDIGTQFDASFGALGPVSVSFVGPGPSTPPE